MKKMYRRLLGVAIVCSVSLSATTFAADAGPSIEQLKEAFRVGFSTASVSGDFIAFEMLKYDLAPSQFVTDFRQYATETTTPFYKTRLNLITNQVGQTVIYPAIYLSPYSISDYQGASYLMSLLEYNKDLVDFRTFQEDQE